MQNKTVDINFQTTDDEPVHLYVEKTVDGLTIKFIKNFREAVEYAPKMMTLDNKTKITLQYKCNIPDDYDFVDGE